MLFCNSILASISLAVFFATLVEGFFKVNCGRPVIIERADPIVNPGAVSGHLHTIMGPNTFDFTMDHDKAMRATCTTCQVSVDKSAYWIPSLWYRAKDGTFTPVKQIGGALIYYLQRATGPNGENARKAFPKGFRMLAGNPMLRSFQPTLQQRAISYACLSPQNNLPETNAFPKQDCPYGLRAQVFFPSCWDGKNLDSPDHKSHVAYPDGYNYGKCPKSHPVPLVSLFYEVLYDVTQFKNEWWDGNRPPFTWSNGDATGYGLHGDFLNGWDIDILQRAIDTCNDPNGIIENCPAFAGKLYTGQANGECILGPAIKEQTTGKLNKLPGCNPVTFGPQNATPVSNCPAPAIGPRETYSADVSSRGWEYAGCVFDDYYSRTMNEYMYSDSGMTVEKCIDTCSGRGFVFAGLEYGRECFCGNSVRKDRLGAMTCTMPCVGNTNQYCGRDGRMSLYKKRGTVLKREERRSRMEKLAGEVA